MADGAQWQRLLQTTTPKFLREVEVNIMRNRKLLAMLMKKGRVVLNDSGTELNWKAKYKRASMIGFSDTDTLTFAKRERIKTATLGWRAYVATDSMSELETLQNKGNEAIVKNYVTLMEDLVEDVEENFCDELYVDGYATGNPKRIHGIESFLKHNAANPNTGFMTPDTTYAGLATKPQTYGGNWTGTWPKGKGDAHYDFWSPILVDYTNPTGGVWTAATKTWPNTCIEALRAGITKTRKGKSKKGMLDMILLEEELFDGVKNAYEGKQQLRIDRNEPVGLWALGFTDVINFDGVDITTEFGVPADTGYMFNTQMMELRSLMGTVFKSDGPYWNEEDLSFRWTVKFYGNTRFNPKYHGKLFKYS